MGGDEMPGGLAGPRAELEELAGLRDDLVAFHQGAGLDPSSLALFVSDAKEGYYRTLLAAELLSGGRAGGEELLAQVAAARSQVRQAGSELVASFLPAPRQESGRALRERWLRAFEAVAGRIEAAARAARAPFAPFAPLAQPLGAAGAARVRVLSAEHVELACSVCGATAVTLRVGTSEWVKERSLLYAGISRSQAWPLSHAAELLGALARGAVAEVHREVVRRGLDEDGLDGYCPACDAVLCREHYGVVEEYDDGFYDCTYGTCPAGHRRVIDD